MCKVVIFTNAKKLNIKETVNAVGDILTDIERDGFGYAVQGAKGVFGERCVDKEFDSRLFVSRPNPAEAINQYYNKIGEYSEPVGGMLLHGRTSTNSEGLENCHPMVKQGHYLIHNGVVNDYGPEFRRNTDNDTENLLHRFINGIGEVEQYLSGYYAFGCFTPDGLLHVVRDDVAPLFMAWSPTVQSYIIATTKSLINNIADDLDLEIEPIDAIKDNVYLIFDGNELLQADTIEPRGYSQRESKYASKSLGYDLDAEWNDWNDFNKEPHTYTETVKSPAHLELTDDHAIVDPTNTYLTLDEFYSLDYVAQQMCRIYTKDGTLIVFENAA